jgi:hypothetical protein
MDVPLPVKEVSPEQLKQVASGKPQKPDGSLDAAIHFK